MIRKIQYSVSLPEVENSDWAPRSEYWRTYRKPQIGPGRYKKYRYREPLILCGHGIRIRMDHNTLLIRNGFTHYPQKAEEIRFFPGDPNLPDRIIVLDGTGGISFDALNWMSNQKIAFVQLNWRGQVVFSGNSGFAANSDFVQLQSEICGTKQAIAINRKLISAKLNASMQTLSMLFPDLPATEIAIDRIKQVSLKLEKLPASASQGTLLGLEGAAAAEYFRAWHRAPLNWENKSRRPIPPNWLEIGSRQMVWQRSGSNARHPVNAMLNYGYAMLISQVHEAIVIAGFDPSIGIAHKRNTNPIPLVYDLMEPLRPVVDRKVLEFALSHTFAPSDFTINRLGGCRLNPQMAKCLANNMVGIDCEGLINGFIRQVTIGQRSDSRKLRAGFRDVPHLKLMGF